MPAPILTVVFTIGLAVALLGVYSAVRGSGGPGETPHERDAQSASFLGFELRLGQSGALILLGTIIAVGVWILDAHSTKMNPHKPTQRRRSKRHPQLHPLKANPHRAW